MAEKTIWPTIRARLCDPNKPNKLSASLQLGLFGNSEL